MVAAFDSQDAPFYWPVSYNDKFLIASDRAVFLEYCSHGRSNEFVIESILYPRGFPAVECDSWKDFKSKRCEDNVLAYMGEGTDNSTRGIFYLDTNAESPYGKGDVEFGYWK